MLREDARLTILDEPFLGLERDRRVTLLGHARQHWRGATLLYVTHDITETRAFDHVLVVDAGRIVEEGDPAKLAQSASSKYRRLLQAQEALLTRFASSTEWRRIRIDAGRIVADKSIHVSQLA
jgi:ATP-binding cassette subfamily B protein